MQTDDLIRSLGNDLSPVRSGAVERRLATGLAAGALVTLLAVALGLGFRPDLAPAIGGFPFWMKWAYTICLGIGAIAATAHLARPDAPRARWLWLLGVPFVVLTGVAINELAHTPKSAWLTLWLGDTWRVCPFLVLTLAIPIFLGLLWAFRRFAPTRLAAAGAAAGFASGACAATIYGLHCPEVSASFVLTWYTFGIGLSTLGGALAGPRLLRW
jgi:hypothetical protein